MPQLVKIFKACLMDIEIQKENKILGESIKVQNHTPQFTEKTFNLLLWSFTNISSKEFLKDVLLQNQIHVSLLSILTVEDNKQNKLIWIILSNMASSSDLKLQMLIKAGIVHSCSSYLHRDFGTFDFSIMKEVAFATCNVAAGTITQIKELVTNGVFKRVWELLKIFNEVDFNNENEINNHREDAIKVS